MHVWSKLSSTKWRDAWEERFLGLGQTNAVIQELPGGKSIRVDVYCKREREALAIAEDSSLLRETLGDQTFSSFIKNKKIEWDQYRSTVTDYEITRYLSVL